MLGPKDWKNARFAGTGLSLSGLLIVILTIFFRSPSISVSEIAIVSAFGGVLLAAGVILACFAQSKINQLNRENKRRAEGETS